MGPSLPLPMHAVIDCLAGQHADGLNTAGSCVHCGASRACNHQAQLSTSCLRLSHSTAGAVMVPATQSFIAHALQHALFSRLQPPYAQQETLSTAQPQPSYYSTPQPGCRKHYGFAAPLPTVIPPAGNMAEHAHAYTPIAAPLTSTNFEVEQQHQGTLCPPASATGPSLPSP